MWLCRTGWGGYVWLLIFGLFSHKHRPVWQDKFTAAGQWAAAACSTGYLRGDTFSLPTMAARVILSLHAGTIQSFCPDIDAVVTPASCCRSYWQNPGAQNCWSPPWLIGCVLTIQRATDWSCSVHVSRTNLCQLLKSSRKIYLFPKVTVFRRRVLLKPSE